VSSAAQRKAPPAPPAAAVMARAAGENFSVAGRLVPRREREHLLAIYGFARLADELGDSLEGDREAALEWLEAELARAYEGLATHPLLARLAPTLAACSLPREPFLALIEANRVDQRVSRYATWEDLRGYCALSADPVGELVLRVFGLATPGRLALSSSICTALQLAEHCQDVAEDLAAGRVYLPQEDLRRFGVSEADLREQHAGEHVRALLAFEVARGRGLLDDGLALVADLDGRPRVLVAGYLSGGLAALRAIERARFDVLAGAPRAGAALRARMLIAVLARAAAVKR
jgi:squalene synthase HpnC